jgi:dipeptidyl aminopeptidase/acylaminoacyl peptidase
MPKRPMTAEDLLRIQFVGDPQMSPDGSRILFSKKHIGEKNKYITNLFTVDLNGFVAQWTQGDSGAGHGRWSPDGQSIAFISGREGKQPQIFLLPVGGGEARKLTDLPEGSIAGFRWSPDGQWIAFSFRETDPKWTQKAAKEREEKGLSTPAREIDSIWYRLDGDGYFLNQRHAIYVVEVATGTHRQVFAEPAAGFYSFDWAPNSKELAITATANKRPFFEPPNAQIFRVDLDGQSWMLEGLPKGDKDTVRWSPDGRWLAYLGDVSEDDPWGVRNNKLYVVSADGGAPRCLTEKDDYCLSVMTLSDTKDAAGDGVIEWSPDSKAIYVSVGTKGEVQLGFVELEKGGIQLLTQGHHAVTVGTISRNGERFATLLGTATKPNEVAVYDLSKHEHAPHVLTQFNSALLEEVKTVEPEELWLESTDGVSLHAWVMKPVDYLEPKRYPAILEIHGGPHTQYGWAFFHEFQVLAAQGYVVVYSNPRGSKGYGEAHCAAIKGDWGNKDWEDIQTVTRWMQHQPYIHPGQMGVMGGSYGGYMTNWVVGHTTDFAAAITDRCVSNLISMAGSSDFPFNKDGYFGGHAWGDLEAIREIWRQSPIAYFDKVKTPTLVIHSEGDLRCNVEQGEQVFHALQAQGVDSRFVRYPQSTFHGMSRTGPPDLRLHRLGEIVSWMDKYLKK